MGRDAAGPVASKSVCQASAESSEPVQVEKVEPHAVLAFLLRETKSISSADAIPNASTNTNGPRSTLDSLDHASKAITKGKVQTAHKAEASSPLPECEPISETDSDDGIFLDRNPTGDKHLHAQKLAESLADRDTRSRRGEFGERHMQDRCNQQPEGDMPHIQTEDELLNLGNNAPKKSQLRQRRTRAMKSDHAESQRHHDALRQPHPQSPDLTTSLSTHSDLLFVIFTLCVLCGYCVAIFYRAFHPISYPLPNVDHLFQPYNVSNVSARFSSPRLGESFTDAVLIEWELSNFPVHALQQHGPEPFEYRVFLNDHQLVFDIGFWSIESDDDELLIHRTIRHRLRPRDIPSLGIHSLRLDVTFAIPGSDDELLTLSDKTTFTFSAIGTVAPHLQILSPPNRALVLDRSFLLKYQAHNVHRVEVIVDKKWRMPKRHIGDGNLLLRGLSVGPHSITLEAFDSEGTMIATKETHLNLQYR